ncbi:MAG: bifunctional glycosyltransferase family 2/GtrA family protein [Anaerolineaceae bacterium]|nr:bifunctional glycosyltransferase family 2/GtrA family protein [Anaerolineaceae bacterium]
MNTIILIPAYQPDEKLTRLLNELIQMPFPLILVVDDGSRSACQPIFDQIETLPRCQVIHHEHNAGKGAALKTGMKAILDMPTFPAGCITVDADGQHLPEDILQIAELFEKDPRFMVLGCRDFSQEHVPPRSRAGNLITRAIFSLFTGTHVSDTQTGLRAIPTDMMPAFLALPGDHYDYEMNMLIQAAQSGPVIQQVPIQTVYIDENRSSHFRPLIDSMRIYKELLKFCASALVSFGIDIGLFALMMHWFSAVHLGWSLLGATAIARAISSVVNFILNKNLVFKSRGSTVTQASKYYLLVVLQMLASWFILQSLASVSSGHIVLLKILTDFFLFMVSFIAQRLLIFRNQMRQASTG